MIGKSYKDESLSDHHLIKFDNPSNSFKNWIIHMAPINLPIL